MALVVAAFSASPIITAGAATSSRRLGSAVIGRGALVLGCAVSDVVLFTGTASAAQFALAGFGVLFVALIRQITLDQTGWAAAALTGAESLGDDANGGKPAQRQLSHAQCEDAVAGWLRRRSVC